MKRYFISYHWAHENATGFNNYAYSCDGLRIKRLERQITEEYQFSSVRVLYYKEMKEHETF